MIYDDYYNDPPCTWRAAIAGAALVIGLFVITALGLWKLLELLGIL